MPLPGHQSGLAATLSAPVVPIFRCFNRIWSAPIFAYFKDAASPGPVAGLSGPGPFDVEPSVAIAGRIERVPPGVVIRRECVRQIPETRNGALLPRPRPRWLINRS